MEEKKETVGKASRDLLLKNEPQHTVIDMQREMQKEDVESLETCIKLAKTRHPDDFYVVILTKKERLMQNVIRNYFLSRQSCPTPEWDQTVYRYIRKESALEYLWTIPSKDTCTYLKMNALLLPEEERGLLGFVLEFDDGTLLRKAKQLNGEQHDSPMLLKKGSKYVR